MPSYSTHLRTKHHPFVTAGISLYLHLRCCFEVGLSKLSGTGAEANKMSAVTKECYSWRLGMPSYSTHVRGRFTPPQTCQCDSWYLDCFGPKKHDGIVLSDHVKPIPKGPGASGHWMSFDPPATTIRPGFVRAHRSTNRRMEV